MSPAQRIQQVRSGHDTALGFHETNKAMIAIKTTNKNKE
jgi:hypothetical protein